MSERPLDEAELESEAPADRLTAARARLAAAEKAIAAADTAQAVARAEQEADNAVAIAEATAKHGRRGVKFEVVPVPDGRIVIVTRSHPATFKRLTELETITFEEAEKFVRPCVVHPVPADWDTLSGEMPAVVLRASAAIGVLMGTRRTEQASK